MKTKLIGASEVEKLVRKPESYEEHSVFFLCTVVEPLEVIEIAKKTPQRLSVNDFLKGWETFKALTHPYVAPLDESCLKRSLFEHEDRYQIIGLWREVIHYPSTIQRVARRLILRPSEENWWQDQEKVYEEMEAWPDR